MRFRGYSQEIKEQVKYLEFNVRQIIADEGWPWGGGYFCKGSESHHEEQAEEKCEQDHVWVEGEWDVIDWYLINVRLMDKNKRD